MRSSRTPMSSSLSSFIGVERLNNVTVNSGRFLINLKPHSDRKLTASQIIRQLAGGDGAGLGHLALFIGSLFQDLSIDTNISATQYQFTLSNQDPTALQTWTPQLLARLQKIPDIVDVASDLQQSGLSAYVTIDRATASRFGVTPATIDSALYDAFGNTAHHFLATIFTQSNQFTRHSRRQTSSMQRSVAPRAGPRNLVCPLSPSARPRARVRCRRSAPSRSNHLAACRSRI